MGGAAPQLEARRSGLNGYELQSLYDQAAVHVEYVEFHGGPSPETICSSGLYTRGTGRGIPNHQILFEAAGSHVLELGIPELQTRPSSFDFQVSPRFLQADRKTS